MLNHTRQIGHWPQPCDERLNACAPIEQQAAANRPHYTHLFPGGDPRLAVPERGTLRRGWLALELTAVFALGAVLMNFIHEDPRGLPLDQIGVVDYDAFYHIKMAALMPEIGLTHEFPWLRHAHFSEMDSSFISHHYGFHVLLMPFVHLSHALLGDYMTGGRWAICVFFGASLMLMQALLINLGVRWRWLWLIVFLLLPGEFFGRQAYVRAISPSLMFMLLIVLLIIQNRHVLAGLAIAGYTHLYLGSVVYTPVIVGTFAFAALIAPRGTRQFPWRLVMWTTLGWLVGLRTYPYFNGALEFLRMQILGTGLNPDIPVGAEWYAYDNVWYFAVKLCGPLLVVWTTALLLRLRLGGRLNSHEFALILLNFAFLFLTLKAQRFIETWPVFCLLSAACLVAPILNPWAAWFDPAGPNAVRLRGALTRAAMALVVGVVLVLVLHGAGLTGLDPFFKYWPVWTVLASILFVCALTGVWSADRAGRAGARRTVLALCGVMFACAMVALARLEFGDTPGRFLTAAVPLWVTWAAVGLGLISVLLLARRAIVGQSGPTALTRLVNTMTVFSMGLVVVSAVVLLCADQLVALQRDVCCGYNLPKIRAAMDYLREISQPGDVVFTDDWDVFPVYFYHNSHNNYIVGLDPKFTHSQEPELWERYVKISRGQVPRTFEAGWTGPDGARVHREIHARLEDIRDYFHCRWVVTDSDHKMLASRLADAPHFAELVYPQTSYSACRNEPYLIFRVRDKELEIPTTHTEAAGAGLYLSELDPVYVDQGWGELNHDRSVSDQPLQLNGQFFAHGIGTHAPSTITYPIPGGFDVFEATVGVSGAADGPGSVVISVELDRREVFRSDVLTSDTAAASIRLMVTGAGTITLKADPTEDGNRFDHVDWAMARLTTAE